MGKINVLDFEIANLIAAGEVVERPSSVMKELIENSIDSGATKIVAEIKRGGVALIRVTDNGSGIEREDLPVALKRHATSKIRTREDLDGIVTLGFRGEALAAISSVSEVTIITKTRDSECGYMLTSEGGRVLDVSEVGTSDGTTVVVENLFFNVPARRKFLKKDSTEAMNVAALVEKVALSRPDISIQLLIDGEERFMTPGDGKLYNAIYAVFGKDFAAKLIKAEGEANGIRVYGYIGRSDNTRKNRNLENVFINGRYVKSLTAMAAIEKAYTSYIAPEAFPTCVLFLEMNPASVDVNVHPAKLEVKFANEQPVFEAVYHTVRRAIEEEGYRPEMTVGTPKTPERNPLGAFLPIGEKRVGEQLSFSGVAPRGANPYREAPASNKVASGAGASFGMGSQKKPEAPRSPEMTPKDSIELLRRIREARREEQQVTVPTEPVYVTERADFRIVGEVFDCYVIVEYDGALLVIDKHAAHERVIFEDLKKRQECDGRVGSQALLLPITVILPSDELAVAEEHKSEISATGFEYNVLRDHIDIVAVPDAIGVTDAEALFLEMIDSITFGKGDAAVTDKIRRERALYQTACKAAIKGGRKYDRAIVEWLVSRIIELPDITVCPHGRPVAMKLTKNELDRQFNRIK